MPLKPSPEYLARMVEYEIEPEKYSVVIDGTDQRSVIVEEAKKLGKVYLIEPDGAVYKTEEELLAAFTDTYEFAAGLRGENIEVEIIGTANAHSMKRLLADRRRHEFAKTLEEYLTRMRKAQEELVPPKEAELPKFRRKL